jgi:hypothetical protein
VPAEGCLVLQLRYLSSIQHRCGATG